jgi:hypothetical protein
MCASTGCSSSSDGAGAGTQSPDASGHDANDSDAAADASDAHDSDSAADASDAHDTGAATDATDAGPGDASSAAQLISLSLSNGMLTPAFAPSTTLYEARLSGAGASVTVTATAADSNSTIKVQGTPLVSGATTGAIAILPATMTISVEVTAGDGQTKNTYGVVVRLRGWQIVSTRPAAF